MAGGKGLDTTPAKLPKPLLPMGEETVIDLDCIKNF